MAYSSRNTNLSYTEKIIMNDLEPEMLIMNDLEPENAHRNKPVSALETKTQVFSHDQIIPFSVHTKIPRIIDLLQD